MTAKNAAQSAIQKHMEALIEQVAEPLNRAELKGLISFLRNFESDSTSYWAIGIRECFKDGDATPFERIELLIRDLTQQALDNPFAMSCIVGHKIMILLLRTTNEQK